MTTDTHAAPNRPSVIVFFTDQQRADTLGVHGNNAGITPNLDLMARNGTLFQVACAPNPVCAPSRSAILTGRYPTATTVVTNGVPLPTSVPTMARSFKAAGYTTGYIGKWHLSDSNPVPAEERADWDHWLASNTLEFTSDAYRTVVWDENDEAVELPGYRSDAIVDAAIRFVADHADEPFFLFVSLIEPHHQNEHDDYPAPDVYRDTYADAALPADLVGHGGTAAQHVAGYFGQIKRVDEGLGRLRDALKSLDLDERTVLAYTADHGSHFKTRNDEYKRSVHDSSIRVPLVLSGPGFTPGRVVADPVSTVDVAATMTAAAGAPDLDGGQGRPLQRFLGSETLEEPPVLVQVSESETSRVIRTRRWTYAVTAVEGGDSGAVHYRESALFDNTSDPHQLDDLITNSAHAEVTAELRAALVERVRRIEGLSIRVDECDRVVRPQRAPETRVRSSGLRGTRFGHQPSRRD